ncbi:MAG: hydroxymethylpyrimidine/phosphomethylpyrimidine kinase [Bacteroidaceae bacterium]|nr:hydroxymethylpyrimidine/phosphomethylpyrimidine kinase [Bacteroidaceae bacterium]
MLGDAWKEQPLPVVLSIAGSDPSAGAGIQQDLKTMTLCGAYGATVITALTSQNTTGVQGVMPVPAETVESQLRSLFADLRANAVKIGMIPNKEVAQAVVRVLKEEKRKRILPVVCDPILLSTSGTRLMSEDCVAYVAEELFPLCTLVTPNLPEHEYLVSRGFPIPTNCLLKGGHAEGEEMTDVLFLPDENRSVSYRQERIDSPNLHGTGCALSSAVASYLAQGLSLEPAVGRAKQWVTQAILGGKELHIGHGNGPLWYNPNN